MPGARCALSHPSPKFNFRMEATTCIRCGTKHWSREPCALGALKAEAMVKVIREAVGAPVANATSVANTAKADVANTPRVANRNRIIPVAEIGADLAKVLKPRRGDRARYNERQREYMRKRRAK